MCSLQLAKVCISCVDVCSQPYCSCSVVVFCCYAVNSAKSRQPVKCSRHGVSAFLQVDSGDLHLARGGAIRCPVCAGRLPCYSLGWSFAYSLGISHHLVCQLSVTLLGLSKLQHRYGIAIVMHNSVMLQVQPCCLPSTPYYSA